MEVYLDWAAAENVITARRVDVDLDSSIFCFRRFYGVHDGSNFG